LIVLDTHVLVWVLSGSERLGRRARAMMDSSLANDALAVSAISFWEVAMLVSRGRIEIDARMEAWRTEVLTLGVREIAIDGEIALRSVSLTGLHADPADRLIAATALRHSAALVTADERLLRWKSSIKRQDARR
jgi:PIN domain nuclease of toxin-antitoxin system